MVIWIARPRTGSAADNRASAFKTSNAAAVIALVVEDLAAVALAAADVVAKEAASPINERQEPEYAVTSVGG